MEPALQVLIVAGQKKILRFTFGYIIIHDIPS